MKEYVFPHFAKDEENISKIKGISRLFAYPKAPHFENEGKIVILDSGAFGLSLQGRRITNAHMKKLDNHYRTYARENTICIGPDEYLNPANSMYNFRKWFLKGYTPNIAPVLQCEFEKRVNMKSLKRQVDFYANFTDDEICFSNNALTGEMAQMFRLEELFKYIKSKGFKWIHVLGAGWDLEDISKWNQIKHFDSLDSIAYYQPRYVEQFGSLEAVENIYKIREVLKCS